MKAVDLRAEGSGEMIAPLEEAMTTVRKRIWWLKKNITSCSAKRNASQVEKFKDILRDTETPEGVYNHFLSEYEELYPDKAQAARERGKRLWGGKFRLSDRRSTDEAVEWLDTAPYLGVGRDTYNEAQNAQLPF